MTYEEWLNVIESLKNTNTNKEILDKLKKEPLNNNLYDLLRPKLESLIIERYQLSVNKIVQNLESIFTDVNYLDLSLLNFKKEIKYLLDLIDINQIPLDIKVNQTLKIKEDTEEVYKILIKEADKIDYTGVFSLTIKNNMIKWRRWSAVVDKKTITNNLEKVISLFNETKDMEDDGYTGTLTRDNSTLKIQIKNSYQEEYKVYLQKSYDNVPSNELNEIPKEIKENGTTYYLVNPVWNIADTEIVSDGEI